MLGVGSDADPTRQGFAPWGAMPKPVESYGRATRVILHSLLGSSTDAMHQRFAETSSHS
jgi:hypothetical protein